MKSSAKLDVENVVKSVQKLQQNQVLISSYHIRAIADVLNLDLDIVKRAMTKLGTIPWISEENQCCSCTYATDSSSISEKWTILMQGAHLFSPLIRESHPKWAKWMNPLDNDVILDESDSHIIKLKESLINKLNDADSVVDSTTLLLQEKGYTSPSLGHILQYASNSKNDNGTSIVLINAAVEMRRSQYENKKSDFKMIRPLFRSARNDLVTPIIKNMESFGAWGYKDSKFVVAVDASGDKSVTMAGTRYNISGRAMPKLIPFLETETNIKVDITRSILPYIEDEDINVCTSELSKEDVARIIGIFNGDEQRISTDSVERARHGTGHSQEDMYIIRSGEINKKRVPDLVVYPRNEFEVESLIHLADSNKWCIIPFGGGTNVSHATWCPPKEIEPRPIISVDMRLMSTILEVNEEDSTVHVQAGITGSQLAKELDSLGFTMGHEPDSIEFSTVGGWIATNSSGMKRNKYGNIEDIVKDVRVASAVGILWQNRHAGSASFGRVSTGTNLTSLVLGSEGALGIITSAVLKIRPLPETKAFESIILHNFDDGVRFVKDVSKLGSIKPASIRLLDNTQFRLGQAMKARASLIDSIRSMGAKAYANTKVGRFCPNDVVCATVTFEGSISEVKMQQTHIKNLACKHGAICAGSEIGKAGYSMTYAIAYIRDFALTFGFLAESFETFVPWSKVSKLISATKNRLHKEHSDRALPGKPIICSRITQLYEEGVCVYFYFCMNFKDVPTPSAVFSQIEIAAREEILTSGGSLSHHHGIGKAKAKFMNEVNSDCFKKVLMKVKDGFDPHNVFGTRNGSYA